MLRRRGETLHAHPHLSQQEGETAERKAHDVVVVPTDAIDEDRGAPLDSVGSRLVRVLPGRHVGVDLAWKEDAKTDRGAFDGRALGGRIRSQDAEACDDVVLPPREAFEHVAGLGAGDGLPKDVSFGDDDRIRADDDSATTPGDRSRLGSRDGERPLFGGPVKSLVRPARHNLEAIEEAGEQLGATG